MDKLSEYVSLLAMFYKLIVKIPATNSRRDECMCCLQEKICELPPPFRDANRIWRALEMASGECSEWFESKHVSVPLNGVRFSLFQSHFVRLSTIGNHLREHSYALAAIRRKSLSCFDWICGADRSDAAHNRHSIDSNMVLWYLSKTAPTFRTFWFSDLTQGFQAVRSASSYWRVCGKDTPI